MSFLRVKLMLLDYSCLANLAKEPENDPWCFYAVVGYGRKRKKCETYSSDYEAINESTVSVNNIIVFSMPILYALRHLAA